MQHLGHPTIHHLHTEGAMTSLGLASINYQHAVGRRRDLLTEAERGRQAAQARGGTLAPTDSVGTAARLAVGLRLIRIGERVARPGARPEWTDRPVAGIAVAGR